MISSLSVLSLLVSASVLGATTLRVPAEHATIQRAIDAARDGDTVLVSAGVYRESLKISGKSITLASQFLAAPEPRHVMETIVDGGAADGKRGASALVIEKDAGLGNAIVGLTFRNAAHAVTVRGHVRFEHNHLSGNGDALSFESGTGVVRFNTFAGNTDDGIDLDNASGAVIEDNIIRDNRDDGIEVRLHKYNGPTLDIIIRRNIFAGNGEDGLQLIDYTGRSSRIFRVERNVFEKNAMAAIACMADGVTKEIYAGAELIERVVIAHNTIVGGEYGIIGGDNMVLVNNVVTGVAKTAIKRVRGDSAAGHNLLWRNGTDFEDCDLKQDRFVSADPQLGAGFRPLAGSPCIDGGMASIDFNGESLTIPAQDIKGRAPDLGAFEASP